jgi:diguanylate cyclase (GGDEF)-like protein
MRLLTLARRVYDYGSEDATPAERQRVQIANLLAVAAMLITSAYGLVYLLVLDAPAAFALNAACAFAYLGHFELMRRGRPFAARGWVCGVFLLDITCLVVLFFGAKSGIQYYFVLGGPIAFFLFDAAQRGWRWGVALASVLLFLLCEALPSAALAGPYGDAVYRALAVSTVPAVIFVLLMIESAFLHEIEVRQRALESAARTDMLTGLPNRPSVYEQTAAMLASARRHGHTLAVMMIDIDHFKRVNDSHGHAAGDLALVLTARALQGALRAEDVLGRIGGEEFLIALSHASAGDDLLTAERLRQRVAEQVMPLADGHSVRCTVSIGVARLRGEHDTLDTLMSRADQALYRAKTSGRNRCELELGLVVTKRSA